MHTRYFTRKSREPKLAPLQPTTTAVTLRDIRDTDPDRLFYLTDKYQLACEFVSNSLASVYKTIQTLCTIQGMNFETFKKSIWPLLSSGVAFFVGHVATSRMTTPTSLCFKLIIGTTILGISIAQRYTDQRTKSSAVFAGEAVSIAYLHEVSFRLSRMALSTFLPSDYALITSLGVSGLGIPSLASRVAKQWQKRQVKRLMDKGAQRSDTATISSGMTCLASTYLQIGDALQREMKHLSRLFQVGLIAFNILDEKNILAQGKNAPALAVDVAFPIYDFVSDQQRRINKDYEFNTTKQKVLRFINGKAQDEDVARADLRIDDLVYCDEHFDLSSVPISGEVIALQQDEKKQFTPIQVVQEYFINLKAKNGEDLSYLRQTSTTSDPELKQVDLQGIRSGQQPGVLTASSLDLLGKTNFFIRVKVEKGKISTSDYKKEAVINDYIMQAKNASVKNAIAASVIFALLFDLNPLATPKWMFKVFQMMIAFSESFARNKVNDILIKELNQHLPEKLALQTTDVLRIVDFYNAINGFYQDRFPQGVTIISDKTGTLTISGMDVLGCWTEDMDKNVQALFTNEKASRLSEDAYKRKMLVEIFICAYTNKPKELESEEHAIRNFLARNNVEFKVEAKGNSQFVKTMADGDVKRTLETFHLGLSVKLGGRFTLVKESDKYYLVFCGVPNPDSVIGTASFKGTPLLESYRSMQPRQGVLSRDWCVARNEISPGHFEALHKIFCTQKTDKNADGFEAYLKDNPSLLKGFMHHGTFIINNPVKKGAENFIPQCRNNGIPVFVATGDNAKAAKNIARVLCSTESKHMAILDREAKNRIIIEDDKEREKQPIQSIADFIGVNTIVFAGLTDNSLKLFDQFMSLTPAERPTIIFAEMSTEDKGKLALHLKNKGYFIAVNGDGTNDLAMMCHAHTIFAHLAEDGTYAAGVEQFANLNDRQLQFLRHSSQSFYELFDLHNARGKFAQIFARMANSQVKPLMGLNFKSSKMGWELCKEMGVKKIRDVAYKHPKSMAYDLIWMGETIEATVATADHPADNKNLALSDRPRESLWASLGFAVLQAMICYVSSESIGKNWMIAALLLLPFVLRSIYTPFGAAHRAINARASNTQTEVTDRRHSVMFQSPSGVPVLENKRVLNALIQTKTEPQMR